MARAVTETLKYCADLEPTTSTLTPEVLTVTGWDFKVGIYIQLIICVLVIGLFGDCAGKIQFVPLLADSAAGRGIRFT